jgi:hypothetical protein
MRGPDLLESFLVPLERLGLPYCVTGSVAASVYGEPRLTADVDVVLLLRATDIAALRGAFPETDYYVPPDETLRLQIARGTRGMFNLIHHRTQFKADVYLGGSDPLHAWALANRRRIALEGTSTWIAPPEYVVLRKLEYFREGQQDKHLRDVRFVVANTPLDRDYLDREVARLGLGAEWQRCLTP